MRFLVVVFAMLLSLLPLNAHAVDAGRFQSLMIKPVDKPVGLVFVVSDITGWTQADETLTTMLQQAGWLAVGVDLAKYRDSLAKGEDTCHDVGDELTNLAQQLERERDIGTYLTPVVIGRGEGGTLAYAAIRQALPASFKAGFAIGKNGQLSLPQALCDGPTDKDKMNAKKMQMGSKGPVTWQYDTGRSVSVLFKTLDGQPADANFLNALKQEVGTGVSISDLPLTVLDVTGKNAKITNDMFVIFVSGDGGWRDIDKTIAEELQQMGIPVVGWDSLRYFWKQKSPEQVAADLGRVIHYYAEAWSRPKVVLIGYSFGADILPLAYNRLPPPRQNRVALLSLLSLSQKASLEIEVEGYLGLSGDNDPDIAPELKKIPAAKLQCVYGEDDAEDSGCPGLSGTGAEVLKMPGDHHFDENYDLIAHKILAAIRARD